MKDTTLCGECGHPQSYHYFGDSLCAAHVQMHTPCGWNGNSVRCQCHVFRLPKREAAVTS